MSDAVSRVTQGNAGAFDIELPQDGSGVEDRSTGGSYEEVYTFNQEVVSGNARISAPLGGSVGQPVFSGNTMTVPLSGIADNQVVTVILSGVTDIYGQTLPDTNVPGVFLIGDVNGDGKVGLADFQVVKGAQQQPVTTNNFRADVSANGVIDRLDGRLVRQHRTAQ